MSARRTTAAVLGRRLRTQRLASAPLRSATEVVRLLGAVQSQERDQALWSLGLRARGATYASVLAELDSGAFVRTHVLRPTWHFVPVEDIRWMLALTGPRIERSAAARHRQLGLDDDREVAGLLDRLTAALSDRVALTRREVAGVLSADEWPRAGERLGHLLLLAEVRGLVCSGPTRDGEHIYALMDDVAPQSDPLDDEDAVRRLALRFFLGHGPASVKDFVRWSGLTAKETLAALDTIDELERTVVDGFTLWGDPSVPRATQAGHRALLLPTYDELTLTYPSLAFPVIDSHPMTETPGPYMNDWWYGTVLHDSVSIGAWKPHWRKGSAAIRTRLSPRCTAEQRRLVDDAVRSTADFLDRDVEHIVET